MALISLKEDFYLFKRIHEHDVDEYWGYTDSELDVTKPLLETAVELSGDALRQMEALFEL